MIKEKYEGIHVPVLPIECTDLFVWKNKKIWYLYTLKLEYRIFKNNWI